MPVYNRESMLSRAIESVLCQTYENFHLVIIDDGSTDNSYEIMKSYEKCDNVFVFKNDANMGISYTRNVGLEFFSKGKWDVFTIVDSDDYSLPNYFETMINKFVDNTVAVFPTNVSVNDDLSIRLNQDGSPEVFTRDEGHAFYSRLVFDNLGYFYDTRHGTSDTEYMWRFFAWVNTNDYTFIDSNELLYHRVIHEDNISFQKETMVTKRDMFIKYRDEIMSMIPTKNFYREKFG